MEKEKTTMWSEEMISIWYQIQDEVRNLEAKGIDTSSIRIVCEDGRTE